MTDGPLTGVRVLDLCRFLAGPYATLVMADLGADVIKVEDPGRPDEARGIGPCWHGNQSLYYLSLNWAKRSAAVRYSTPAGREVMLDLVRSADVVVDNFRPGVMAKLGLAYEDLRAVNELIVTCSISAFGATGAYADQPGYDYTIQALSGVMSLTGETDGPPTKAGISYVDHAAGLAGALAVVTALFERHRTGRGRALDVSLMDVQTSMLTYLASWQLNAEYAPARTGSAHPSLVPAQNFATADGHLSIFVGNDRIWRRLVDATDDVRLRSEEYASIQGRQEHRDELVATLGELFAGRTTSEWVTRLQDHGVPSAPVNSLEDATSDPHVRSRGLVVEATHPAYGEYRHASGPFPAIAPDQRTGAPLLGEQTDSVLSELGYSSSRITALARDDVIVLGRGDTLAAR